MRPSTVPLHWRAFTPLLQRLPQAALSRAFGRLADVRLPRVLRRPVLGAFARIVGADVDEAELSLADYPSLDAFFVRRLKADLRAMPDDPLTLASPVDGLIASCGAINNGELLQVKGIRYPVADLLGDASQAECFDGGVQVTIYLSPKDYHRIHAPCSGHLDWARHTPGALLPVNPPTVRLVPDLFVRNERLACTVDGPGGRVAVVAVGAFNVGRISSAFDPGWNGPRGGVTNRLRSRPATRRYDPALPIERGNELMAFHLGSTVVVLLEKRRWRLRQGLHATMAVRLGQELAVPAG